MERITPEKCENYCYMCLVTEPIQFAAFLHCEAPAEIPWFFSLVLFDISDDGDEIFQLVSTMPADALTSKVARASAGMGLVV